jgi:chemotaxis protein methyltransferase CheR
VRAGTWRQRGYADVAALVQERAGLVPPAHVETVEEGIDRAMVRAGLADLRAYRERLAREPELLDDLLVELTVGETYFFRTPEHFAFVRDVVLPEVAQRKGPGGTLVAWSAGCSSGEEAYSLALVLLEAGWGGRMRVLGTDVSRAALARARAATYGEWSLRGPEAGRMRPHLRAEGKRYVLDASLRERVELRYLNLATDRYPDPAAGLAEVDVLFCRNVLIYFDGPTITSVVRRFHDTLAPGGYLVPGPSDPSPAAHAPFEPVLADWGVVYRRRSNAQHALLPQPASRPQPLPQPLPLPRRAPSSPLPAPRPAPPGVPRLARPEPPPPALPSPPPRSSPDGGLHEAHAALRSGEWGRAARLAGTVAGGGDEAGAVLHVRAQANVDAAQAARTCAEALRRHPLSVELRHLYALLLLGQGRAGEAAAAARQALYLEPELVVGHLTLGLALRRAGDREGAARALRTAEALARRLSPDAAVPLAEGELAGALAEAAARQRALAEGAGG